MELNNAVHKFYRTIPHWYYQNYCAKYSEEIQDYLESLGFILTRRNYADKNIRMVAHHPNEPILIELVREVKHGIRQSVSE